ncbi:hypothetical protein BX600DRAFT_110882 [Xylariales sp. PMI_506]|nr:hypothetical protein BX600DRAFT_110882 [Xylariales sp. PMI_506]
MYVTCRVLCMYTLLPLPSNVNYLLHIWVYPASDYIHVLLAITVPRQVVEIAFLAQEIPETCWLVSLWSHSLRVLDPWPALRCPTRCSPPDSGPYATDLSCFCTLMPLAMHSSYMYLAYGLQCCRYRLYRRPVRDMG